MAGLVGDSAVAGATQVGVGESMPAQFTARLWVPAGTLRCMETESTVTVRDLLTAGGTPDVAVAQLGVLWGKSAERGGGQPSLLVTHLLDTAAVAEVM